VPVASEQIGDVGTDETRASGDQDPHAGHATSRHR
jgi:hypothetical protein